MKDALPARRVYVVTRRYLASTLMLVAALACSPSYAQVLYTYDNNTSLAIPDNGCPTRVERTFVVSETFNVGGNGTIAVGIDLVHTYRGDLLIELQAPNGNIASLAGSSNDGNDNYRVMFSSNLDEGNPLNDLDVDPAAAGGNVLHRRLVGVSSLDSFYSGPANGTWRLRICDAVGQDTGTLNAARLVLRDNNATAPVVCASSSSYDWGSNGNSAFTSGVLSPDGVTLTQSTSGEP
ncbi:MAG: proprotein convertase P-domain-containing protein, partial [Xanthomonadales bacterium]|nr:proprotein convertase P-domain-containing protein [Xanthomonadales bacterium]